MRRASVPQDECVVEMRLYVPPKHARLGAKAASGAGSDGEEGEEAEDERSTTELFLEEVQAAGGIEHVTGDAIVEIPEEDSLFLTPRCATVHSCAAQCPARNSFPVLQRPLCPRAAPIIPPHGG